jgi:hypothetical protein
LNIINLVIDDEIIYNRVFQVLNEVTFIEIDCLKENTEQIEELIESSYQIRPELLDRLNASKCHSRRRFQINKVSNE